MFNFNTGRPLSLPSSDPLYTAEALAVRPIPLTKPTYVVSVSAQANTASSDAIAIEAGAAKKFRLQKLVIMQPGIQTTAGLRVLQLLRTTTAGTAGVVTADPLEVGDAFSGIARAKPSALGTAGAVLLEIPVFVPTALAAFTPIVIDFCAQGMKPVIVDAAVTNGIALRDPGAAGGANFAAYMIVTEE